MFEVKGGTVGRVGLLCCQIFLHIKIQSNPDNWNLQGKKKMVRVIGSSSYRELRSNDQK